MECNQEEAEKCFQIAVQKLEEWKPIDSRKFLNKSIKLFPTQKAEDLLEVVLKRIKNVKDIQRIQSCETHYDVLEVSRDAFETDIIESYKKIVLLVHPDKNPAPEANEAFLKVKEAKIVLTSPVKRSEYNLTLGNENQNEHYNGQNADIWQNGGNVYYRQNADEPRNEPKKWWQLKIGYYFLIFLPVILLILLPMLYQWLFITQPIFSFKQNTNFPLRRRTLAKKIPYYVSKEFREELQYYYNGSLVTFERQVKSDYKTKLEKDCLRERRLKEGWLEMAANVMARKNAESLTLPSCDELKSFIKDMNSRT